MNSNRYAELFGEKLEDILYERRMTQRELSRLSGIGEVSISKYINGRTMPSIDAIIAIRRVLDCSFDDLLDFDINDHENSEVSPVRIRRDFKQQYPDLAKQLIMWCPHSYNTIVVEVHDGYFTYNYDTKDLRQI